MMRLIATIMSILLIGMIGFGQTPTPTGSGVTSSYDKFEDATTVITKGSEFVVTLNKAATVRTADDLLRNTLLMYLFAGYKYRGQVPITPDTLFLGFRNVTSNAGGDFRINPSLIVLADEQRFRLGEMSRSVEQNRTSRNSYYETLIVQLSRDVFLKIFTSKKIAMKIGEVEAYFSDEQLAKVRELTNQIDPQYQPPKVVPKTRTGLVQGKLLSKPEPQYPSIAKTARAQGTVAVKVEIDENGNVIAAQAISGHPLLQQAAVTAARQAKFEPTSIDGQPVKTTNTLSYHFTLR